MRLAIEPHNHSKNGALKGPLTRAPVPASPDDHFLHPRFRVRDDTACGLPLPFRAGEHAQGLDKTNVQAAEPIEFGKQLLR